MQTVRRFLLPYSLQTARRALNIHEADSYEVLNAHGVQTPRARVAFTPAEASRLAAELGTPRYVVKAQVLAGGRGKGRFDNGLQGGVHIVDSPALVADIAGKMLGARLITKQTGAEGLPCHKVLIAEPVDITHEYYLALVLDRKAGSIVLIGSAEGGMNIEEVAAQKPDAIVKIPIDVLRGMKDADAAAMAAALHFEGPLAVQAQDQFRKLYAMMLATDATQVEINPLVTTADGRVLCADAKLNFDDNAEFRQPALFQRRDQTQEHPLDVEAASHDLNYIRLSGSIGCLVNGAGLAMATMDLLHHCGGEPANFLDVGGSANARSIAAAFRLLSADPSVRAIFVNIFGGIMSCQLIASGMVEALAQVNVTIPIVIRLMGTHMEEGAALLKEYKGPTPVHPVQDLDQAAQLAVALSKQ